MDSQHAGLCIPLALSLAVTSDPNGSFSLPQDTTDYVAYVAKDPVNRRGEQCLTHLITHSWEARLNTTNQMFLITSASLANEHMSRDTIQAN